MFRYKSCAKINSFLNVLRKLPSGYHQITTHYQLINIFDEIEYEENPVDEIETNANLGLKNNSIFEAIDWFNHKFKKNQKKSVYQKYFSMKNDIFSEISCTECPKKTNPIKQL